MVEYTPLTMDRDAVRSVAAAFRNDGRDYQWIGRTVHHHTVDKREKGGLTIFTDAAGGDSCFVYVPTSDWYTGLHPADATVELANASLQTFQMQNSTEEATAINQALTSYIENSGLRVVTAHLGVVNDNDLGATVASPIPLDRIEGTYYQWTVE